MTERERERIPMCAALCREGLPKGVRIAEGCPGLLGNVFVADEEGGGEGYFVQVCPNPELLGSGPGVRDWCGDGPDEVLIHSDTIPPIEEIRETIKAIEF